MWKLGISWHVCFSAVKNLQKYDISPFSESLLSIRYATYNVSKALWRTKTMPRLAYQLLSRAAKNRATQNLPLPLLEATQSPNVKLNQEFWTTVYTNSQNCFMLIARGEKRMSHKQATRTGRSYGGEEGYGRLWLGTLTYRSCVEID